MELTGSSTSSNNQSSSSPWAMAPKISCEHYQSYCATIIKHLGILLNAGFFTRASTLEPSKKIISAASTRIISLLKEPDAIPAGFQQQVQYSTLEVHRLTLKVGRTYQDVLNTYKIQFYPTILPIIPRKTDFHLHLIDFIQLGRQIYEAPESFLGKTLTYDPVDQVYLVGPSSPRFNEFFDVFIAGIGVDGHQKISDRMSKEIEGIYFYVFATTFLTNYLLLPNPTEEQKITATKLAALKQVSDKLMVDISLNTEIKEILASAPYQKFLRQLIAMLDASKTNLDFDRFNISDVSLNQILLQVGFYGSPDTGKPALQHFTVTPLYRNRSIEITFNEKTNEVIVFVTAEPNRAGYEFNHVQLGMCGDAKILEATLADLDFVSQTLSKRLDSKIIFSGYRDAGCVATALGYCFAKRFPSADVRTLAFGSRPFLPKTQGLELHSLPNFYPICLRSSDDTSIGTAVAGHRGLIGPQVRYSKAQMPNGVINYDLTDDSFNLVLFENTFATTQAQIGGGYDAITCSYGPNIFPAFARPKVIADIRARLQSHLSQQELPTAPHEVIDLSNPEVPVEQLEPRFPDIRIAHRWIQKCTGIINLFTQRQVVPYRLSEVETNELIKILGLLEDPTFFPLLSTENKLQLFAVASLLLVSYLTYPNRQENDLQAITVLQQIKDRLEPRELEHLPRVQNIGPFFVALSQYTKAISKIEKPLFWAQEGAERQFKFDRRLLKYIGVKLAYPGFDQGNTPYLHKVFNDLHHNFQVDYYVQETPNRKPIIVVTLFENKNDNIGVAINPPISGSEFVKSTKNASIYGQKQIVERFDSISHNILEVISSLAGQRINPGNCTVLVSGFGTEGSVATLVGFDLATTWDSKEQSRVQVLGLGSPEFLQGASSGQLIGKKNLQTIRLSSSRDSGIEIMDSPTQLVGNLARAIPGANLFIAREQLGKVWTLDLPLVPRYPYDSWILNPLAIVGHNTAEYCDESLVDALHRTEQLKTIYLQGYQIARSVGEIVNNALISPLEASFLVESQHIDFSALERRSQEQDLAALGKLSKEQFQRVNPSIILDLVQFSAIKAQEANISNQLKQNIRAFFKNLIEAIKHDHTNINLPSSNPLYMALEANNYTNHIRNNFALQRIISPELEALELDQGQKFTQDEMQTKQLYYRGKLHADLHGNRYKPIGLGVNGTMFVQILEATREAPYVGVLKPHPKMIPSYVEKAKETFGQAAYLNKRDKNRRVHNERYAYKLATIFGFTQTVSFPTTILVENHNDGGRVASFCAFLPGFQMVKDRLSEFESDRGWTEEELTLWQMSKLLDFVCGNLDGHEGNAFVQFDGNRLAKTGNFDYDKGFIASNPAETAVLNQYKWTNLPISRLPITSGTINLLNSAIFNDFERKLAEFETFARSTVTSEYASNSRARNTWTEQQATLLRKRFGVLQAIKEGKINTLSDLANYKSDAQLNRY